MVRIYYKEKRPYLRDVRAERHIHLLVKVGRANSCPALERELRSDPTYKRFMKKKTINNEEGD